jgi:hypothetical protein
VNGNWFWFCLKMYQIIRRTELPHAGVVMQVLGAAGVQVEGEAPVGLDVRPFKTVS